MNLMNSGTKITFLWRLVNGTHEQKIEWSPIYRTEHATESFDFIATIGRFRYWIVSRDGDDYSPYDFTIFSRPSFDSDDWKKIDEWHSDGGESLADPLHALYQEAKKRALGLDSVVSDMFEDLAAVDGLDAEPDASRP